MQRDAERGEKISPEAMDLVKGTELETGAYLDKLKRLSPEEQKATTQRDLAGRAGAGGGTKAATGPDPAKQHQRLLALLDEISAMDPAAIISGCPARERAALCTRLSHLIDAFQQIMEGVAP